jgi:hypothetical protein
MTDLNTHTGAIFSDDRKYRYALWRKWDFRHPCILFIGLNPSRANEHYNDPTITRCIDFAKRWGYGGLYFGNLFAYRSPFPNDLLIPSDPVGVNTDEWLSVMNADSKITVFAWGQWPHQIVRDRAKDVENMFSGTYCFGYTKNKFPKHPLYLPKITELIPYETKKI